MNVTIKCGEVRKIGLDGVSCNGFQFYMTALTGSMIEFHFGGSDFKIIKDDRLYQEGNLISLARIEHFLSNKNVGFSKTKDGIDLVVLNLFLGEKVNFKKGDFMLISWPSGILQEYGSGIVRSARLYIQSIHSDIYIKNKFQYSYYIFGKGEIEKTITEKKIRMIGMCDTDGSQVVPDFERVIVGTKAGVNVFVGVVWATKYYNYSFLENEEEVELYMKIKGEGLLEERIIYILRDLNM